MELNEVMKKFMDTTLGLASATAEKMVEFTENMSKKGQEFKEDKKEDFEKFVNGMKSKFQETSDNVMKALHLKDDKVEKLVKEVEELKKEVEKLKKGK